MEVIARFPALPDDRADSGEEAAAPPDTVADTAPHESDESHESHAGHRHHARPAWRGLLMPRQRTQPRAAFPFRSVLALAVVAVVVWGLALKSDAARRQEARLAQAPAGSVPR